MSVVQVLVAHTKINVEDTILTSRILRDRTERSNYRGSVLLCDLVAEEVERRALFGKYLYGAIKFHRHYAEHVDCGICVTDERQESDCAQHDPLELIGELHWLVPESHGAKEGQCDGRHYHKRAVDEPRGHLSGIALGSGRSKDRKYPAPVSYCIRRGRSMCLTPSVSSVGSDWTTN